MRYLGSYKYCINNNCHISEDSTDHILLQQFDRFQKAILRYFPEYPQITIDYSNFTIKLSDYETKALNALKELAQASDNKNKLGSLLEEYKDLDKILFKILSNPIKYNIEEDIIPELNQIYIFIIKNILNNQKENHIYPKILPVNNKHQFFKDIENAKYYQESIEDNGFFNQFDDDFDDDDIGDNLENSNPKYKY